MALVWRAGSQAPVVVDFKDQAPAAASLDNPAVLRDGRLVDHGPAALNIPGVVAGMEHLHQRYGSGRIAWADLIAPAVDYAAGGFVLDGALPATVAEGQAAVGRNAGARALFMPGGRLPQPGDRFVNADLADTLRIIAAGGADAFYRGELAQRMVDDLAGHGGILTRTISSNAASSSGRRCAAPSAATWCSRRRRRSHRHGPDRSAADAGSSAGGPWSAGWRATSTSHLLIETFRHVHLVRAVDPAIWPDQSAAHLEPRRRRRFRPDRSAPVLGTPPGRRRRRRPAERQRRSRRCLGAGPGDDERVRRASAAGRRRWSSPIATATWWWSPRR
jgi:hypothetical protein